MVIRPVDENGDILPVLSPGSMKKGAAAAALLIGCRLNLLTGDWWENPEQGNPVIDMLGESRLTEADRQALAACLASYIRETPGVVDVRDAAASVEGRRFSYSCTVETGEGTADIRYEL